MGRLQIVISDDLETKLRNNIPNKKGEISKIVEKALADYLEKNLKTKK